MNKKIAILGAGGHGKVVGEIAILNNFKNIEFFDDAIDIKKKKNFPFKIKGNLDDLEKKFKNYDAFFVAIGDNKIRFRKIKWLCDKNLKIINLIHPTSTISSLSFLDIGICVMANAVINPGVTVEEGVIINTSSSIDHDCMIEKFVHISPNCTLSGNVKVGKFSHLGAATSVHPGINIGNDVKTGVGSKVFKNILNNIVYTN